jgi:hypothetical protein
MQYVNMLWIFNLINIVFCRARATNTQLGKEENSGYIRLQLDRSESVTALFDDLDEDQPPVIVVGPADLRVVRGQSSAELQCIANARQVLLISIFYICYNAIVHKLT